MPDDSRAVDDRSASQLDDEADREELRQRYEVLLQELRIALPGVQVLLAFLFTVPFAERFGELDELGRDLFGVAMVSALLAVILLLTPTVIHRIGDRTARSARLVWGIRTVVCGLAMLALALLSALWCVSRYVFGDVTALLITGPAVAAFVLLWLVLPRFVGPRR